MSESTAEKGSAFIGIDPGANGALALVNAAGELIDVASTPTETVGTKQHVSAYGVVAIIQSWQRWYVIERVTIEKVNAMPKQGVSSSFNFGVSWGIVRGICAGLGLRTDLVTPPKWKALYALNGKPKDQARTIALARWPSKTDQFTRKKDVDRAEAALIALVPISDPGTRSMRL